MIVSPRLQRIFSLWRQLPIEESHNDAPMSADRLDNDDDRPQWDWTSRYPRRAWMHITIEALYLCLLLASCFVCFLIVWLDIPATRLGLAGTRAADLNRYLYYVFGGLLGGTLFGIKWHYHAVARGLWHLDRIPWRFLTPLLSAGFAFATAFVFEAGLARQASPEKDAAYAAVGFFVGYFSDRAVAKMSEVANVVFGSPGKR